MSKVKDTAILAVEENLDSECDSNISANDLLTVDLLKNDLPNIDFSQILFTCALIF
jgi:hypothetical protein